VRGAVKERWRPDGVVVALEHVGQREGRRDGDQDRSGCHREVEVDQQQQVDGDEGHHGEERRPPERAPFSQVPEQVAAKQHLLGDAVLQEQAERHQHPAAVQRYLRSGNQGEDRIERDHYQYDERPSQDRASVGPAKAEPSQGS
jgi:hypothetical protein